MTIFQSLILGIVEGITEFLPISSTGHLILATDLLKLTQTEFLKSFEIIIQLGAIASVVVLYWRSFLNIGTLKKLAVGFLPTGIIGFTVYRMVKTYLLGNEHIVLYALFIGGIALIVFEMLHREGYNAAESIHQISYKQALGIGVFQALAIIPGVSRSAATIVGGLLFGLRRRTIVEFSFLLAVPTMLAASGLDLAKNAASFSGDQTTVLIVGFITSFAVALASIKFLLTYIQKNTFIPFGIYRIAVALVFWFIVF